MTNPPDSTKNSLGRFVLPRRDLAWLLGFATFWALPTRPATSRAAQPEGEAIAQPQTADQAAFIQRAFEMRRLAVDYGDQAFGAVVVRDGEIVGQSWSRVVLDRDPTAHAELAAIRDAARRLNDRDLSGAVLYSSSRACPMCEAAAYWARIDRMVHGKSGTDAGSPRLCG